jgi:hypothetical protein
MLLVQTARTAEQRLITEMGTACPNVFSEQVLGTARDVLAVLDRAAAAIRTRKRTEADADLILIAPAWLRDQMRTDLTRSTYTEPSELPIVDSAIDAMFRARHIVPNWSLDWSPFGAQQDGQLAGWPSAVSMLLFTPGCFVFLDGGRLDIGVVRDVSLVGTNDALVFAEQFEAVAMRGAADQSLYITAEVCPDGTTSAPKTIDPCPQGS